MFRKLPVLPDPPVCLVEPFMTAYIIRRIIQAVFVIIIITLLIFFAMRLLPGDPILIYMVQSNVALLTPEMEAGLRHEFGLDQPLMMQYVNWMAGLFRGDLRRRDALRHPSVHGDLFARLRVALPAQLSPEERELVLRLSKLSKP